MSSKTIYHYAYRITNTLECKHYYGSRTSKIHPSKDLGKKYFSSSKDKEFKKDQKENPQNYKYKVIRLFDTREGAVSFEIRLHNKFDVGVNESFYNKAKQTSVGWDTTGMVNVRDTETGETLSCSKDDPKIVSGEYNHILKGKVVVIDTETGEKFHCSRDNPLYLSGKYEALSKGRMSVIDTETGDTLSCKVDDENFLSGRYVSVNTGTVVVKDIETGEILKCKSGDEKFLSGRYVSVLKGRTTVRDIETGETLSCSVDHPLYLSGRYEHINKGRKDSEDARRNKSNASKGKVSVIDLETGETFRCSIDNNNYVSGRYIHISKIQATCIYCGTTSNKSSITRWHNDNCKHKPKEKGA